MMLLAAGRWVVFLPFRFVWFIVAMVVTTAIRVVVVAGVVVGIVLLLYWLSTRSG